MEQRKEIVNRYVQLGLAVSKAVTLADLSKSSYYYQPNGKRKGKAPSKSTMLNGRLVENSVVVSRIQDLAGEEFLDYGYRRISKKLRKEGYRINKKKVYRLMKENKLVSASKPVSKGKPRTFVRYSAPRHVHPFATIELDIKYVYLSVERRNAYLLTALDTFTRIAIEWELNDSMKNTDVISLLKRLMQNPLLRPYQGRIVFLIRTDNGPQFIAHALREAIICLGLNHEFIHPGTPQENAHIESFHSTLQKIVIDQYDLPDLIAARTVLTAFYNTYNNKRIMESILDCSPIEFLKTWEEGKVDIREHKRKQKFFFRERQAIADPALSREDFTWVH